MAGYFNMKKKKKTLFNRTVAWLHLWPSIVSGIILVFVCLTGTIVVYGDEIMDLSGGEARFVKPASEKISYIEIQEILKKKNPNYGISEIVFFKDPTRSLRLRVYNKEDRTLFHLYMNPYTGEIIKEDHTIYFFFICAHLHAQLMAGPIGGWIVALSTIIFFISSITGLILWWPKKWTRATKKASFTVRWKAKFKRLNYDLHNVFGFYSLLLAIVLSATGLLIFFHPLMDSTIQLSGGNKMGLEERLPKVDTTRVPLDMVKFAYQTLNQEFTDKESVNIWTFRDSEYGAYPFTAGKAGLKSIENADIIIFDKYTGKKLNIAPDVIKHNKVENTVWQLHMGQWWGQFGKLSTFLAGLISTSLPITGFLIWWGRRKKKKKKK